MKVCRGGQRNDVGACNVGRAQEPGVDARQQVGGRCIAGLCLDMHIGRSKGCTRCERQHVAQHATGSHIQTRVQPAYGRIRGTVVC